MYGLDKFNNAINECHHAGRLATEANDHQETTTLESCEYILCTSVTTKDTACDSGLCWFLTPTVERLMWGRRVGLLY